MIGEMLGKWRKHFHGTITGYMQYRGPEPTSLQEAFEISLVKWRLLGYHGAWEGCTDGADLTCGLCMMFFSDSCKNCPIYNKTFTTGCGLTPYTRYYLSKDAEDARGEYEFLVSLYKEWKGKHAEQA